MDWANERYVRIYTRDTADDLVLSWQAAGLWPQLVRKADRSGVIATNHGPRGVAALVRWPVDVVAPALAELVEDGRILECFEPRGYIIPNYLPAQETPSSDKQRQKETRDRRSKDANTSVTKRDGEVTKRDANVTNGHAASHGVTPCLAVPSHAVLGRADVVAVPRAPRSKGAAISADWKPRDQERIKATELGLDCDHEADEFHSYWLGTGRAMKDWNATFRSRLLSQAKRGGFRQRNTNTGRAEPLPAEAYAADEGRAF